MSQNDTQFEKYTKIWSGPKQPGFFNPNCSLGRVLFNFMRNNPTKICQISVENETIMTNREAVLFGIRIAEHLRRMGLKQDEVVGIICSNTMFLMPLVLGCLFSCTTFHAINYQSDEEVINLQFSKTRPKVIFCDGNVYPRLGKLIKLLKTNVFTINNSQKNLSKIEDLLEITDSEDHFVPQELKLGGDQTIAILNTAGTTGPPKPVCISNSALLMDFDTKLNNQDTVFTFCTIDWLPGLQFMLQSLIHNCTRIIIEKPFSTDQVLDIVHNFHVSVLTLTPSDIRNLINCPNLSKHKLVTLRRLNIAGGNCTLLTLMKLRAYLNTSDINYGYSLTECGDVASNNGLDRCGSVGKLLADIKVKIVDDSGRSLSHGGIGEIIVHNGKMWNGYYGNPSETKRMQDYQNWFHTNDLGYFDSENFLHVIERKQHVLKFHGVQYWPQEIENVITELPEVLEACVFGLWNQVDGDAAAAAVVKVVGSKLSEQDIVEYVARRMVVTHKQLHCGVFFLDNLPKNVSGKVLRNEARDQALGKKWQPIMNGNHNY